MHAHETCYRVFTLGINRWIVTDSERLCCDQLNTVSKWIMKVAAADAGNVIHFGDSNTRAAQMYEKVGVILATEGGVSLLCWTKVVFHS